MTTIQHKSNNKLIKAYFARLLAHICQKRLSAQPLTTKHQSPSHTNLDCSAKFTRVFHVFQKWCWDVLGILLATSFSAVGKVYILPHPRSAHSLFNLWTPLFLAYKTWVLSSYKNRTAGLVKVAQFYVDNRGRFPMETRRPRNGTHGLRKSARYV